MRHLFIVLSLACGVPVEAQVKRLEWKPSDYAPLMEVPWEREGATLEDVLKAIFREPDQEIRYLVLEAYLDEIALDRFEEAFKTCIAFEGHQCPERLVNLMLRIWGRRDPAAAWEKGKSLFEIIVPRGDVLKLDSWTRPRQDAINLEALRKSDIWLRYIDDLGMGLEAADVPQPFKNKLLKEFSDLMIERLGRLPRTAWAPPPLHTSNPGEAIAALRLKPDEGEAFVRRNRESRSAGPAAVKIGLIKWLTVEPGDALLILRAAKGIKHSASDGEPATDLSRPSAGFLIQWAKLDLPGMVRWAESLDTTGWGVGTEVRGMLMSRVDDATRNRWLNKAKGTEESEDLRSDLFDAWASWDPERAIKEAFETRNGSSIDRATQGAAYRWVDLANGWHQGFKVLLDWDLSAAAARMTDDERYEAFHEFGIGIMELWTDVDIGESARFGFTFVTIPSLAHWFPRENLIKLFSGDDEFSSDADMIDRTFCALRFWAFWKPDEMRQWIGTVDDAEMRKALTWLLEHPMHEIPKKEAEGRTR